MNAALTTVWTVLAPLAQQTPDPEDVKPGWLGFGVFLLLAAAVVFLAFSFRKQIRRVNFPGGGDERPAHDGQGAADRTDTAGEGPADPEQGSDRRD
jgi:hypothetical protein